MDLRVKLNVFEGPFDLLLHLIKVNEMDIYDIRIAEITHQYMEYLTAMQELDLEVAGDYLVLASTLLNIKSRQILPAQALADENETEEELDELMNARDLIKRLVEYRDIKDMAQDLRVREREYSNVFFRTQMGPVPTDEEARPPAAMREDIQSLFDAFVKALRRLDLRRDHVVRPEIYKIEDKIEMIKHLITTTKTLNAFDLFKRCLEKQEVIVTFIAILELCRLGQVLIRQDESYNEILIEAGSGRPVVPDEPAQQDGADDDLAVEADSGGENSADDAPVNQDGSNDNDQSHQAGNA